VAHAQAMEVAEGNCDVAQGHKHAGHARTATSLASELSRGQELCDASANAHVLHRGKHLSSVMHVRAHIVATGNIGQLPWDSVAALHASTVGKQRHSARMTLAEPVGASATRSASHLNTKHLIHWWPPCDALHTMCDDRDKVWVDGAKCAKHS
jgi:hypothetical protein